MAPLRMRDADGVAHVIQVHLDMVGESVVVRVRELMANGHLAHEATGRRRRTTTARRTSPRLLEPLAG
jgi:hypothetical protein